MVEFPPSVDPPVRIMTNANQRMRKSTPYITTNQFDRCDRFGRVEGHGVSGAQIDNVA